MGLVFNLIPLKTTEKEKGRRFRILFRAMIYSRKAGAEGVSFKNKMKKKKEWLQRSRCCTLGNRRGIISIQESYYRGCINHRDSVVSDVAKHHQTFLSSAGQTLFKEKKKIKKTFQHFFLNSSHFWPLLNEVIIINNPFGERQTQKCFFIFFFLLYF